MLKTLLESSTECKLLQKLGHHKLHQVAAAKIQNLDAIREEKVKSKIQKIGPLGSTQIPNLTVFEGIVNGFFSVAPLH